MRLKVRPKIKERLKSIFMNLFGLSNKFLLGGKLDKLNIQKLKNNRKISLQKIFYSFLTLLFTFSPTKKIYRKVKIYKFFLF